MANLLSFSTFWFVFMTILTSVNGQGLRLPDRRKMVFQWFNRKRFDIICVQETHWSVDLEMEIKREWGGDIYFAHGTAHSRGVAILVHSRLDHTLRRLKCDNEGRVVNVLLDLEESTINIICIYAPRTHIERRHFFSGFDRFLSDDYVNIVTGDFNCIMDTKMDKLGGNPNARHSAVLALNDVSTGYDLIDIWRLCHRHEHNFTWAGKDPADTSLINKYEHALIFS